MKLRLFDNINLLFEYIDLSDLEQSMYILGQFNNFFSDDYLHEDYYDGKDVEKDVYRLPTLNRFCFNRDGVDYYVGDKVLVKGTKKIGNYETEIIVDKYNRISLKENKTYFNRDVYVTPIIKKVGTIYDQYLKK